MRRFYQYEMIDALTPPAGESMSAEGLLATIIFFLFTLSVFLIVFNVILTVMPPLG